MDKSPFDNTYLQSVLIKAGIRFNLNKVDTICERKLGVSFYAAIVILLCLFLSKAFLPVILYLIGLNVLVLYVLFYTLRLMYYRYLRAHLRKDRVPIVVEAYGVVYLDRKYKWCDNRFDLYKYAVIYKEIGTAKPRFFLGACTKSSRIGFIPEQIARVFIDRKDVRIYSIDDKSAYQTQSKRNKIFKPLLSAQGASISPSSMPQHKDNEL